MIPHPQKGAGPQPGAKGPQQSGPFGTWPDEDHLDEDQDEDIVGGHRDQPE